MRQKKNNTTLLILLLIVIVLIGALELYERYGGGKLRNNLTDVKIAKITRIALSKAQADQYISLRNEQSGWFITADKVQIPVSDSSLEKMYQLLETMQPLKVVSSKSADWEEFETVDALSLRVTAYNEKEILSDLFIGKCEKDDTTGETVTFVRVRGEDEIYAVKGDVRKVFEQDFFKQVFPE